MQKWLPFPFLFGASVREPRGSRGVIQRSRAIYSSWRCNEVDHCFRMQLRCLKSLRFLQEQDGLRVWGFNFSSPEVEKWAIKGDPRGRFHSNQSWIQANGKSLTWWCAVTSKTHGGKKGQYESTGRLHSSNNWRMCVCLKTSAPFQLPVESRSSFSPSTRTRNAKGRPLVRKVCLFLGLKQSLL